MPAVTGERLAALVGAARAGDAPALNELAGLLMGDVYRLALRMTANPADAEDATQEVMIKAIAGLRSFRGESSVRTWVYAIAARHLLDRRKSRVELLGLDFERFGADLLEGLQDGAGDSPEAQEVKLGCSLALLTCLDRDHRIAYLLGEVFDLPAGAAAQVAGVGGAAYRQRLSRARRQVEAFTKTYCGVVNPEAPCRCDRRVARATELGRLQRGQHPLSGHPRESLAPHVQEMEALHGAARLLRSHPQYRAPERVARKIEELIETKALRILEE